MTSNAWRIGDWRAEGYVALRHEIQDEFVLHLDGTQIAKHREVLSARLPGGDVKPGRFARITARLRRPASALSGSDNANRTRNLAVESPGPRSGITHRFTPTAEEANSHGGCAPKAGENRELPCTYCPPGRRTRPTPAAR